MGKKKKKSGSQQRNVTAQDRSVKRSKSNKQPGIRKRMAPNWPLTALAGFGMALTMYLTINYWAGEAPLYCAEGSSCDIVQQSHWGTFLGLPTAFWGFLSYSLLAYIGFKVRKVEQHWKSAWTVSIVGLGYSVYLTFISHVVIDALCPYCLISLATMFAIFVTINVQRPEVIKGGAFTAWVAKTAVVALLVVGGMHLHYTGSFDPTATAKDPYLKGLALHLNNEGAVLYGAFWCPACKEQKFLFESAADDIQYVECSPGGRKMPQAGECRVAGIKSYPTWIINGKKYVGKLAPERLAEITGYSQD